MTHSTFSLRTVRLQTARLAAGTSAALLAQVAVSGSAVWAAPALTLVQDGKPAAVIVVPAESGRHVRDAAFDLRNYIKEISGAELPLKTEDKLTPAEQNRNLILVGQSALAQTAGAKLKALAPEGYLVQATPGRLILAGRDDAPAGQPVQAGTAYAVSSFLEEDLGVRWLWPGQSGTVIPRRVTIEVEAKERTSAPAIAQRQVRDLLTNRSPRWRTMADAMGITEEQRAAKLADSKAWYVHQKLGASVKVTAAHAFTDWYEKYHAQHPDWFALQKDGTRTWPTALGSSERAKLDLSNPGVLDQFVAQAQEELKANPSRLFVTASPNDSAYNGNCLCEKCLAWDVKDAPPVKLYSVDKEGKVVNFDAPSLTDRTMRFYNLAAERLEKVAPGKLLTGIAYGPYKDPPLREKLRPNVAIGFVGFGNYLSNTDRDKSRKSWDDWSKAAQRMFLRPNTPHVGYGMPLVYVHRLGQDLQFCTERGLMAVDYDTLLHHWGTHGLNYYVLAKLLWNPWADVDAIVADYCRSGFGAGATDVATYFRELEILTEAMAAAGVGDTEVSVTYANFMTPKVLDKLQVHLDAAQQKAAGDTPSLERISVLQLGLQYARLQTEAVRWAARVMKDGKADDKAKLAKAISARQGFYRANLHTMAFNVPDIMYRESVRPQFFFALNTVEAARSLQLQRDEEG